MKSITIRDRKGMILVKVLHRKSSEYELIKAAGLREVTVEVRDNKGHKIMFNEEQDR